MDYSSSPKAQKLLSPRGEYAEPVWEVITTNEESINELIAEGEGMNINDVIIKEPLGVATGGNLEALVVGVEIVVDDEGN